MGLRGLMSLFFTLILLLFYNEAAATNAPPEESSQNDTVLFNVDSTGQLFNNLTIADVRSILEMLLLILKRNPGIPTLKLLGQFIRNIARHNEKSKTRGRELFVGLDVDGELQQLLRLINLEGTTEMPRSGYATYERQWTSKLENDFIEGSDMATPPETIEPNVFATYNPESILHVPKSDTDEHVTSTEAFTFATPSSTPKDHILKSPPTSKPRQRAGGLDKHPTERGTSSFKVHEDVSGQKHELEGNFSVGPKTIEFETFPLLTDELLKNLRMNNLRYVRTYSEVLEPVDNSSDGHNGTQYKKLAAEGNKTVTRSKRSILKKVLNIS